MRSGLADLPCCDRCAIMAGASQGTAKPDPAGAPAGALTAVTARRATTARRRLLKTAVFRPQADTTSAGRRAGSGHQPPDGDASQAAGFAGLLQLPRTVSGPILDVSPHLLVLGEGGREQRFILTPDAVAWRGFPTEPAALRQDDLAIVRMHPFGRHVADRIWANIGRVTGVIIERSGNQLVVDEGATRPPQVITVQPGALGRIQVRFPTLEPGYLVDIIGTRQRGELIGMIPATSQPAYPAHRMPVPPLVSAHVPDSIAGSATWHEPRNEPPGILGVRYPALDPEAGCAEELAGVVRHGYARMPFLAIGSVLRIRNDCTGASCLIPVTGCAPIGRLFNDRCVTCGTSPRGRVADLTLASFIALGGELEQGCFNATITIGE